MAMEDRLIICTDCGYECTEWQLKLDHVDETGHYKFKQIFRKD